MDTIEFDERSRWLRLRRASFEIVCNFAREPARLGCKGDRVLIATHEHIAVRDGQVELPDLAGALIH